MKNPSVIQATLEFEEYLRDMRGLTATSIVRFKTTIGQFLFFIFPSGPVKPRSIQTRHIVEYLKMRGAHFQERTLRTDGSAIKSYLRFLYGRRFVKNDLSSAVPSIACWRNQHVIHTASEAEMLAMLRSCNLDARIGVRDYAVLLLLMRYGLRPIEVARLKLEDIGWNEKKPKILGKGNETSVLPLESDVATALRRYTEGARPLFREKHVFLRSKPPIAALRSSSAVSAIVRRVPPLG